MGAGIAPEIHSVRRLALLVAGAFFREFLDGTIMVPALPRVAESLGTNPVDLHAGITAYLLTVAVFILPGGWAAECHGARAVFTTAVGVFTLGSLLCGLAGSTGAFAARVLQRLGGAMMVPVGRLAMLRATVRPDLMRAIALLTWPGLTAPSLGPPPCGFLAEHFTWRMTFWVNLLLEVLSMVLALRLVPVAAGAARRPFDGAGFALAATWCLCTTLALDLLGEGAGAWGAIALLAASAGAAGPLLWRHLRRHPHPLLDTAPFETPTFRTTMLTGTAMRTLVGTMPFLLPLLFQLGYGQDAVRAGLLALFAGNLGIIKPLTRPILRRARFRRVLVGNGLTQAVAHGGVRATAGHGAAASAAGAAGGGRGVAVPASSRR